MHVANNCIFGVSDDFVFAVIVLSLVSQTDANEGNVICKALNHLTRISA